MSLAVILLAAAVPFQQVMLVEGGGAPRQQAAEAERPENEPTITVQPRDPVAIAMEDWQTPQPFGKPPLDPLYLRWVWIPQGDPQYVGGVKFATHSAVSRSTTLPELWSRPDGKLVRLDFRTLATNPEERKELLKLWDKLAQSDPFLYAKVADAKPIDPIPVGAVPYAAISDPSGDAFITPDETVYFRFKTGEIQRRTKGGVWELILRPAGKTIAANTYQFGPHLFDVDDEGNPDYTDGAVLQQVCGTETPICHYRHFVRTTLTTIKGGLYYEFANIKAAPANSGQTDFEFFADFHCGLDRKTIDRLRALRRAIINFSGITGNVRAASEANAATGPFAWTDDWEADSLKDPRKNPFQDLVQPVFDATEAIGLRANGMQIYGLFDGQGKLAISVPEGIAKDTTIPSPHPAVLVPGSSCMACHGVGNDRGYKTFHSDGRDLLLSGRLDVKNKDPERIERIASLYRDHLDRLNVARVEYSKAVKIASGLSVKEACAAVETIRNEYEFSTFDAARALADAGVKCDPAQAVAVLNDLVPDVPGTDEDYRVVQLKAGQRIVAREYNVIHIDLAWKIRTTLLERQHANRRP